MTLFDQHVFAAFRGARRAPAWCACRRESVLDAEAEGQKIPPRRHAAAAAKFPGCNVSSPALYGVALFTADDDACKMAPCFHSLPRPKICFICRRWHRAAGGLGRLRLDAQIARYFIDDYEIFAQNIIYADD